MSKIFCQNCKRELKEDERPCSQCGCPNRIYHVNLTATLTPRASLGWKQKRPGFKKPIAEGVNRTKKSRDPKLAGQEVEEVYVIDRIKKWWHHIVKDVLTGEVIHKEDKPLDSKK